jgi:hypothetical protein
VEYVDKSDHLTNTALADIPIYVQKNQFFHLLDILILNGFIPLTSSGSELSYMFQTFIHQGPGTREGKDFLTLGNPTGKFVSVRLDI